MKRFHKELLGAAGVIAAGVGVGALRAQDENLVTILDYVKNYAASIGSILATYGLLRGIYYIAAPTSSHRYYADEEDK